MPSLEDTIDDKIAEIREEFEEVIDNMKNDIDDISQQIPNNKKHQDQASDKMNTSMERLRRDLKQLGNNLLNKARGLSLAIGIFLLKFSPKSSIVITVGS